VNDEEENLHNLHLQSGGMYVVKGLNVAVRYWCGCRRDGGLRCTPARDIR
jgi:hypothetical protein